MTVIVGKAVWSLIVSIINNLVVPWLGDVIQQFSRLPTTPITHQPYDYPDLLVSVLECCIVGFMAVVFKLFRRLGREEPGRVHSLRP